MKRIVTLLLLFGVALSLQLQGQCVADSSILGTGNTLMPVPGTPLPDGAFGMPYDTSFTVWVPDSMTFPIECFIPFPFPGLPDSMTVKIIEMTSSIVSPFTGLSDVCSPATCTYPSLSLGCFSVTGTPTSGGSDTLVVEELYTVYIDSTNSADLMSTIPQDTFELPTPKESKYPLFVDISTSLEPALSISKIAIYPNPAREEANISFSLTHSGSVECRVYDVKGQLLDAIHLSGKAGMNSFQFPTTYPDGVYLVSLRHAAGFSAARLVVQK